MSRIAVVEDDPLQLELIRRYLEREGHDVVLIEDGSIALRQIREHSPVLIILDVMLPGVDGLTICRTLREEDNTVAVLMLTARSTENDLILGLELGADDYLTKPYSPRELVARVRAMLRRSHRSSAPPTPAELTLGGLSVYSEQRRVSLDGVPVDLTRVEFDLLHELMLHRNAVLSRSQLLERVYGTDRYIGGRTVDTHVKNIRTKIESDPRAPSRLLTVYGVGYRLVNPDQPIDW